MLIISNELRPSPIHGLGVFALEPVVCGGVVWRFLSPFDTEFPAEALARLTDAERRYLRHYAYHSRFTGLYVLPGDHDRFMNHSDAPNVVVNPDGSATCVAARAIVAGEELTCDYRTFDREWATKLGCA